MEKRLEKAAMFVLYIYIYKDTRVERNIRDDNRSVAVIARQRSFVLEFRPQKNRESEFRDCYL